MVNATRRIIPSLIILGSAMGMSSLILYAGPHVVGADISGCPSGTVRQASAADVAQFQEITGSTIQIGSCLTQNDINSLGLNAGTSQAIQDLSQNFICPGKQAGYNASIPASQLKEQYVYFTAGQQAIDPKFVVCVDKYMNAAKQQGLQPCLTAALRTVAGQQASCQDTSNKIVCGRQASCSPSYIANSCPHVKGIAVDVNSPNMNAMHALAAQYGLAFPVPNDTVHIQPANNTCSGGGSPIVTTAQTPSQSIANLLNPQSQWSPVQPGYCIVSAEPLIVQPCPQTPQPAASAAPAQTLTTTASSAQTPAATPASTPVSSLISGSTNTNTNVNTNVTATSATALLEALANPAATTSTATGTPVQLNANENVAEQIGSPLPVSAAGSVQQVAIEPTAQQTFTSGDLGGSGASYLPGQTTTFQMILANLKSVLLSALNVLKPFGGIPASAYVE